MNCEKCWKLAAERAAAQGGSVMDYYLDILDEHGGNSGKHLDSVPVIDPHGTEAKGADKGRT